MTPAAGAMPPSGAVQPHVADSLPKMVALVLTGVALALVSVRVVSAMRHHPRPSPTPRPALSAVAEPPPVPSADARPAESARPPPAPASPPHLQSLRPPPVAHNPPPATFVPPPVSPSAPAAPPGPVIQFGQGAALDGEDMAEVPAGAFLMGESAEEAPQIRGRRLPWRNRLAHEAFEEPVHEVFLDAFRLDRYEVTRERFARFVESTGYVTDAEKRHALLNWRHPLDARRDAMSEPRKPVTQVSWNDAATFCRWAGKRLPTEAEWEKAARGGLEDMTYPWGNDPPRGHAWFSMRSPMDVGGLPPNKYRLYDMAGNAMEWCADHWDPGYYKVSPHDNPPGPHTAHGFVLRGGSFARGAEAGRCAWRFHALRDFASWETGFRCASPRKAVVR